MATHSSILAWRVLWTEEPGGLLSIGSHRVEHDWGNFACMHALEKEMATHSSILAWRIPGTEEPVGCTGYGVAQGQTWLKWLSSSSSSSIIFGKFISPLSFSQGINQILNKFKALKSCQASFLTTIVRNYKIIKITAKFTKCGDWKHDNEWPIGSKKK